MTPPRRQVATAFDRPDIAGHLRPAGAAPVKPRITFSAVPADVERVLRNWADGASNTAVLVAMVRHLAEPDQAPLRARILADAVEYAREQRRR